jgi:hypothetical protein
MCICNSVPSAFNDISLGGDPRIAEDRQIFSCIPQPVTCARVSEGRLEILSASNKKIRDGLCSQWWFVKPFVILRVQWQR